MMLFVIGGSGSGKSSYAEMVACTLAKQKAYNEKSLKKYYLATMKIFDKEGEKKVARHKKLRCGKGFVTIEQPINIADVLKKMENGKKVALLECISNLVANEMFIEKKPKPEAEVTENIIRDIVLLKEQITHLVIVSNNVFEDGVVYDKTTVEYIHAVGKINQKLAALACHAVEVVAGIPVILK